MGCAPGDDRADRPARGVGRRRVRARAGRRRGDRGPDRRRCGRAERRAPGCGRRDPPRPARPAADGGGVTLMPRPAFWRVDRPEEGGPRLVHLDRDRRLVEAAQADPARFEALYRKYLAQVYSYAFYELHDHHEAEDATERTFLNALANLARFEERARPADGDGASTFRVWLFQIARNAIANERRDRRNHPAVAIDAAGTLPSAANVEAGVVASDEAAAASRAVAKLPADRRRA